MTKPLRPEAEAKVTGCEMKRACLLACALLVGCAHAGRDDTVLGHLDEGFSALEFGDEKAARQHLARAHESFDKLGDAGFFDPLFRADIDKPYRGRPHERVLATSILALLDARQGRCDLAIPAAHDAIRTDARFSHKGRADTALPALVGVACADKLGRKSERARFMEDLKAQLGPERAARLVGGGLSFIVEKGDNYIVLGARGSEKVMVWDSAEQERLTKWRVFRAVLFGRDIAKGQLERTSGDLKAKKTLDDQAMGFGTGMLARLITPEEDPRRSHELPARVWLTLVEDLEGAPLSGERRGRQLSR